MLKNIGIGQMNFSAFRENNSYFVDKTHVIEEIMNSGYSTMLFTRPRRFGKTLMQTMLRDFLCLNYEQEPNYEAKQQSLFEGLTVSSNKSFCAKYMGQYPVVFVSFKNIDQNNFKRMRESLLQLVEDLYLSFDSLIEQSAPTRGYLSRFNRYLNATQSEEDNLITSSLSFLSALLQKVYNKKVIVLIDEYDVPINRGHSYGFYNDILPLIRGMLYPVVKDDRNLVEKCILTGCNRISKESIFTGMNNAVVCSVSNEEFADAFGFTNSEVDALLEYYGLSDKRELIRDWYDGYHFNGTDIYNPWDVMCYCNSLLKNSKAIPKNYWSNTSGNEIIKEFIDYADEDSLNKMQSLLDGNTVKVRINEQVAYPDMEKEHSAIQLFSVLYSAGYLTALSIDEEGYELKIPNREIQELFKELVSEFYSDPHTLFHIKASALPKLMAAGYEGPVNEQIDALLTRYLSVRNTGFEIAYHMFFVGLLSQVLPYEAKLRSEPEAGNGYADISFIVEEHTGIILEFKKGKNLQELENLATKAVQQVEDRQYQRIFTGFPVNKVCIYGIACFGKKALVKAASHKIQNA